MNHSKGEVDHLVVSAHVSKVRVHDQVPPLLRIRLEGDLLSKTSNQMILQFDAFEQILSYLQKPVRLAGFP
jgi:hypothetical protein